MTSSATHSSSLSREFGLKKILQTFSMMSSSTLVAIFFSAISTKVLAVSIGTSGIALVGLYRNLAAFIGGIITLGFTNVVVQQISLARTQEKVTEVINASALLFILQCLAGTLVALLLGPLLAQWTLGHIPSTSEIFDIRIVILMALVNIGLQTVTAILRGQAAIKWLSFLQPATAVASFFLIFPLVQMGSVGLALNVASGSVIGALIGAVVVQRNNSFVLKTSELIKGFSLLKSTSLPSLLITFQSLTTLGALLGVQSLISRTYGLDPLGNYNAAFLIIDTGTLILMSSVRAYFLPGLGKLDTEEEKKALMSKMMSVLLCLGILGGLVLMGASSLLIPILFSKKFLVAGEMLMLLSLSLIGLVYIWSYNTFLLHKGAHWQYVVLDTLWSAMLFGTSFLVCYFKLPPLAIPICYAGSCSFSGLLYAGYVTRKYGSGYLSGVNVLISVAGALLLGLILWWRG